MRDQAVSLLLCLISRCYFLWPSLPSKHIATYQDALQTLHLPRSHRGQQRQHRSRIARAIPEHHCDRRGQWHVGDPMLAVVDSVQDFHRGWHGRSDGLASRQRHQQRPDDSACRLHWNEPSSPSTSVRPSSPSTNSRRGVADPCRYVVFLSGLAEVSVPGSGSSGFVLGGADGILFAADTQALSPHGHVTKYLAKTVALEIPTLHGKIPAHKVLHAGGCTGQDLLV